MKKRKRNAMLTTFLPQILSGKLLLIFVGGKKVISMVGSN